MRDGAGQSGRGPRPADRAGPPAGRGRRRRLETAVETAENDLRAARAQLEQLTAGGTPEEQAAADAQIEQARGLLDVQLAKRAGLRSPSEAELAAARAAVESAEAAQYKAERDLAAVGSRTAAELQTARDGVEEAENTLYTDALPLSRRGDPAAARGGGHGPREPRASAAPLPRGGRWPRLKATVEQARGQRDLAVAQSDQASVYAPFAGPDRDQISGRRRPGQSRYADRQRGDRQRPRLGERRRKRAAPRRRRWARPA